MGVLMAVFICMRVKPSSMWSHGKMKLIFKVQIFVWIHMTFIKKAWMLNPKQITLCLLLLSVKEPYSFSADTEIFCLSSFFFVISSYKTEPYSQHSHTLVLSCNTHLQPVCFIIAFLIANQHSHSLVSDTITPLMFYFLSVCSSSSLIHRSLQRHLKVSGV